MSNAVIYTNKLAVGYGRKVIREGIDLSVAAGEFVALLGRNGGGKSTLLRTLAGLQKPLAGSFSIPEVALVLTEKEAIDSLTIHDVVAMGRYKYMSFLGGLRAEDETIIAQSLAAVACSKDPQTEFSSLSDGEKQKVLIAKALAQQTDVILLDEPTSHLDIPSRIAVFQLLQHLAHDQHKTILLSTHELDLARKYADRLLPLDDILEAVE